ncbi:MAG: hypothetical protein JWQ42_1292 [Edaphobacter sp.]|nr:hypothetical protein [Edaphobacter sp.]
MKESGDLGGDRTHLKNDRFGPNIGKYTISSEVDRSDGIIVSQRGEQYLGATYYIAKRDSNSEAIILQWSGDILTTVPPLNLPSLRVQPTKKPTSHQSKSNESQMRFLFTNDVVTHGVR